MALENNTAQLEAYRQKQAEEQEILKIRMGKIKHKIAVISGKGGVGKSTVTVNLATAFALQGHKVGILDADIHGPSVPKLLGVSGQQVKSSPAGAFPVTGPLDMKVMSIDFFLDEASPTIWRGPLKMRAIKQFLVDIVWGELDYLFIDLPPGTGDEPLSIAQLLPELDGVIIVTMPSELSSTIVKKSITFAETLKMSPLGVVENMSGFVCPKCGEKTEIFRSGGGEKIAQQAGVRFLGSIPIDPKVGVDSDEGTPFVLSHKDSAAAKAFMEIVAKVQEQLKTVK
ncbi:MAG: Mrp/NBP35 family ATP-binding protein [Candidatus Bathyarchaeota archaeon]|jgi:ATP-binding protein involved in chromosome partitioning|nr:Mrp/NBP35 family ATP-binding protein [Candidatus Bathyarchaeota archaeon]MDD4324857.1 Mrp/NBP35 family ATP-binding protein [Candidatus Bathyarchaeota archaeon]MDT8781127.1 Mrp/NBP35 family ATP-binding protein [Candidatus Bathyarchaeota archaeon]NLD65838.1 Mrp/NBP35 family ATP-binding protein [Thermoproteota archaeon]